MLAKTRSYSIRVCSNHISTKTSCMSLRACIFSRNLGAELVELALDALLGGGGDAVAVQVLVQSLVAADVVEGLQQVGLVLGLQHALHALLRGVVAGGVGGLEVVLARLVGRHGAGGREMARPWSGPGGSMEAPDMAAALAAALAVLALV